MIISRLCQQVVVPRPFGSALSVAKLKEKQIKGALLVKATALKKKILIEQAKLQLQIEDNKLEIENAIE